MHICRASFSVAVDWNRGGYLTELCHDTAVCHDNQDYIIVLVITEKKI